MILCASPRYLETHGTPQTPYDLLNHNCLIYTMPRPARGTCRSKRKEEVISISGRLLANNGEALLRCA
jgi:DNA-binding transcriptional LysR family regulator